MNIAVVGLGRAGRARVAAIQTCADFKLAGTVSRRTGFGDLTWGHVLSDPAIGAVCICTENSSHYSLAMQALLAGKHVCSEYPLAASASEAAELFGLAGSRDLAIHCGLIGLLLPSHLDRMDQIRQRGLRSLHCRFQGAFYGWVAEEASSGRWGQLAVGRLHALWALAGPLALRDVRFSQKPGGYRMELWLEGDGLPVHLEEERGEGHSRSTAYTGELGDGAGFAPGQGAGGRSGLFSSDLSVFQGQMSGGHGHCPREEILAVLRLAEQCSTACLSAM
jgi:biliverdin reductase